MKAAILALVILGVAFAQTQDQVVALIDKIDATAFGHTLFETVFLQLQSGDPLDTLLQTLGDLEDRYVAEQKEDDANNREFQDACNYEIAGYDKDLAESNTLRIQLEAKLEGDLYPRKAIFTGVVAAKTREVAGYNKDIDELDAVRSEEKEEFEEKVREHEEASAIITEARRLFESLVGGAFLEKGKGKGKGQVKHEKVTIDASGLALLQKQLHEGVRRIHQFKHRKSYAQFVKILATITNKSQQLADGGHLQRIIDLCDALLKKIQDSLDLERFAEDKRVEAHKKARHLLVTTLNAAQSELANCQVELASINDNIERTETSLENTNQRIENVGNRRADRWTECEEAAHDYQEARAQRDSDRSTVSETIGLVNAQLRTLKEQLAMRLAAGDKLD